VDYLERFRDVTDAFERELAAADPQARLASLDWTVHELGAHLGGVHRWVTGNIRDGQRGPRQNVPVIDVPVADYYREGRRELLGVFESTDASAEAWTMSRADRTVRFWHRRQLFESLVHLWDLRSASGPGSIAEVVPPVVHVDGVREVFEVYVPRADAGEPHVLTGTIALEATDADARLVIGPAFTLDATSEPDAVVRGEAHELLLFAWNRIDAPGFEGDERVLTQFQEADVRA
jgi:uncharacterized protein (TIGR03083 family)